MRSLFLGDTSPVCLGGGLVEGPHPMVPTWLCSHKSSLPHLESEGCQRFHWWEGKPRQASDNPGLSGGWARRWGEAGILAWLHLESWPSCPPVTHALKGTTFLPGGQPGVFKLGLDSTGVPGDSCSCGPPPLFPPTALAPSRSHLIRSALFTDERMSVGPTVQEEMETGKCHTASRSHSRRSASPCGFVLLCPGAPRYEAIKEGATHTVDLGVPFPGPCGAFRSSVPFPPPLIQTHLHRPRLWPRPCGPARRRAARVL